MPEYLKLLGLQHYSKLIQRLATSSHGHIHSRFRIHRYGDSGNTDATYAEADIEQDANAGYMDVPMEGQTDTDAGYMVSAHVCVVLRDRFH